jgi:hypothetical protein
MMFLHSALRMPSVENIDVYKKKKTNSVPVCGNPKCVTKKDFGEVLGCS